jgi:ABC-2 type transport system ATP-binding protein
MENTQSVWPVLEMHKVSKVYREQKSSTTALNSVSLSIASGEIIGLLGLNGAGKSTLIKSILHLVIPTSGSVLLFGHRYGEVESLAGIGYLPESFDAPGHMTAEEVLSFLGTLGGLQGLALRTRIIEVLRILDSADLLRKMVRTYSRGMKVRLGLAQAMLNKPRFLILDEPTDGLDPGGIHMVRRILLGLRDQGTTILISSHMLSELELLADRIIIIHEGNIVREGNPRTLLPHQVRHRIVVESFPAGSTHEGFIRHGSQWVQEVDNVNSLQEILVHLHSQAINVAACYSVRPTLEEVFFQSLGIHPDDFAPDRSSGR